MIAVGLAIAAWSVSLAFNREPVRELSTLTPVEDLPRPPAPERLPPGPEQKRSAAAADAQWQTSAPVELAIRVRNVPRALLGETTGVATFLAETGADFVWLPLAEATAAPDGSLIATSKARAGDKIVVTLATSRAFARHGYLARAIADVANGPAGSNAEIPLDVAATTVRLQLPPTARRAGPLQLTRVDDPHWLPMTGSNGVSLAGEAPLELLLGAGQYELSDPFAPARSQRFEAPASQPVVLSESLTVLRAGRP
ncbi:MAG TPA: hypothetical protein VF384_19035 [Planctomycetota bacterium]